eukprot:CAMPEP_0119395502 /NCGR_PEP_ID=MMETSP1334-20130426/133537_1 /TAXON_ID=127549 /ORGANISM="Calcidiscus leptoporus, Strain RCC1130" /LENGTH=56 /DNA_ID=CAMNT_0007418993 /DNA_START=141 /DNA_END=308 /DNA_ORIENTATION=+
MTDNLQNSRSLQRGQTSQNLARQQEALARQQEANCTRNAVMQAVQEVQKPGSCLRQ